ncbi:MAG: hypothetical protein DRI77_05225 [Chloroflexi bacterium]|nr:MAG: hypothetical protein B6I35_15845 [Anaerolineaceae bacterium 4572_32.2]RLC98356.1 MAG: hypothetical protein DRI77_05225 [Chloroflexota bacterium]
MDTRNSGQREKFAEPRGWALKWVFAQEAAPPAAEQAQENYGRSREKFAEPRGWAMMWDGFTMSKAEERQDGSAG